MCKNTFTIQNIFNLLKSILDSEKNNNSNNFVYNSKNMNLKISKLKESQNEKIFLKFYITLTNL